MGNGFTISQEEQKKYSIEDYFDKELILLYKLKQCVKLEQHREYSYLKIRKELYDYFINDLKHISTQRERAEWERIGNLVFLFIHLSNRRDMKLSITEKELGEILGVSERTVQRYVRKCRNHFFNILSGNNIGSYYAFKQGKSKYILPNEYLLSVINWFNDFGNKYPKIPVKGSWVKNKINYKKKEKRVIKQKSENTIVESNNKNESIKSSKNKNKRQREVAQNAGIQSNVSVVFEHFNNPIYQLRFGFDAWNAPYPSNWCHHPDKNAHFKTGRWYGGVIHSTKKGDVRKHYLESIGGLTHEIDLHNAIFYFFAAFLPDDVSKEDKERYCELVKSGKLYEDAIERWTDRVSDDYDGFGAEVLRGTVVAPDRDFIKKKFQEYLNNKGRRKIHVAYMDPYFREKFPTIREWLLTVKETIAVWLFWIETDFMSYYCEKLSAENIKFEWLHDGVYVSEKNGARAEEIWMSVRHEFEERFMSNN